MKRIIKKTFSEVLRRGLKYGADTTEITMLLLQEQHFMCAYTEEQVTIAFAVDIEHFDPTLKKGIDDDYYNWYIVSHKFNNEKGTKWGSYQPILKPSAHDLEKRIIYSDGVYELTNLTDLEAYNLRELLDLNNFHLIKERRRYIKRLKFIKANGIDLENYLFEHPDDIKFRRAIETEFHFLPVPHFSI